MKKTLVLLTVIAVMAVGCGKSKKCVTPEPEKKAEAAVTAAAVEAVTTPASVTTETAVTAAAVEAAVTPAAVTTESAM